MSTAIKSICFCSDTSSEPGRIPGLPQTPSVKVSHSLSIASPKMDAASTTEYLSPISPHTPRRQLRHSRFISFESSLLNAVPEGESKDEEGAYNSFSKQPWRDDEKDFNGPSFDTRSKGQSVQASTSSLSTSSRVPDSTSWNSFHSLHSASHDSSYDSAEASILSKAHYRVASSPRCATDGSMGPLLCDDVAPKYSTPQRPIRRSNTVTSPLGRLAKDASTLFNASLDVDFPFSIHPKTRHNVSYPEKRKPLVFDFDGEDRVDATAPPTRQQGNAVTRDPAPVMPRIGDSLTSRHPDGVVLFAQALQFHRASPSRAGATDVVDRLACELCGALVLRWAVLWPCGHRACSACCCSGVNQVSTTPPREHTCAACQTVVQGITLSAMAVQAAQAVARPPSSLFGIALSTPDQRCDIKRVEECSLGKTCAFDVKRASQTATTSSKPRERLKTRSARKSLSLASLPKVDRGQLPSTPTQRRSSGYTIHADESLVLSEDASFYRPRHIGEAHFALPTAGEGLSRHIKQFSHFGKTCASPSGAHTGHFPDNRVKSANCVVLETEQRCVVRIDNVPWTTSYDRVVQWIPDSDRMLPDPDIVPQPVHVPIDVVTGKTANSGFIELRNEDCAKRLIRRRNNTKLEGRPVTLLLSSYEEVQGELFWPSYPFAFDLAPSPTDTTAHRLEQLASLMDLGARQLKSPLKPVEYLVSMVQLMPESITATEGQLLVTRACEVLGQAAKWFQQNTNSPLVGLEQALHRLTRACVVSTLLHPEQKVEVLLSAQRIPYIAADTFFHDALREFQKLQRNHRRLQKHLNEADPHPAFDCFTPSTAYTADPRGYPTDSQNLGSEIHPHTVHQLPISQSAESLDWPVTPVSATNPSFQLDYPTVPYQAWPTYPHPMAYMGWPPPLPLNSSCTEPSGPSYYDNVISTSSYPKVAGPSFSSAANAMYAATPSVAAEQHSHSSVHSSARNRPRSHNVNTNSTVMTSSQHSHAGQIPHRSSSRRRRSGESAFQRLVHSVANRLADNHV